MNCFWCAAPLTGAADTFGPPGQEYCAMCWYEWGRQRQQAAQLEPLIREAKCKLDEAARCSHNAYEKHGPNSTEYATCIYEQEGFQENATWLEGELLALTMLA